MLLYQVMAAVVVPGDGELAGADVVVPGDGTAVVVPGDGTAVVVSDDGEVGTA